MAKTNNIKNNCDLCAHCVQHYIKIQGQVRLVNSQIYCGNKDMTASESIERINNEVECEHFELISMQPTELECISDALSGIMSELYEIKLLMKERKEKK